MCARRIHTIDREGFLDLPAYLLILFAVVSRALPHPWWNFTAVGGSLLYFGARRPLREAVVPVAIFAALDYYLTIYAYDYPFHLSAYLLTWAWYAAVIVLGHLLLRRRPSAARVATAVLFSSTSFFLASNYAVWVGSALYPHTLAGLGTCFLAALPFYRNDLLSTGLVAGLAFGMPALARRYAPEARHTVAASRIG